jgi:hypothetical protein
MMAAAVVEVSVTMHIVMEIMVMVRIVVEARMMMHVVMEGTVATPVISVAHHGLFRIVRLECEFGGISAYSREYQG